MSASMLIDQAGLPPGVAGQARTDGLLTGALVTLTSVAGGVTSRFRLLWVPPADTTAVPTLAEFSPGVWTFTPLAGAWGSYRIELIVDEGLPTEQRQIRIFGIRSPNAGLLVPAANERADANASLANMGPAVIAKSEDNEPVSPFITGNPFGWSRPLQELYEYVETLSGGGGSSVLWEWNGVDTSQFATDNVLPAPGFNPGGLIVGGSLTAIAVPILPGGMGLKLECTAGGGARPADRDEGAGVRVALPAG